MELMTPEEKRLGHFIKRCSKCGARMVIRQGPYGPFMACSRFPACRKTGTMPEDWKKRL